MKKLYFFFLINLFTFVQSASYACNFLNVPIGTSITKLYNTYENLYQVDADETDDTVYKYTYRADDFCKEEELNNTYLFVFVQNLKLIGFRIEILHDDLSKDNLFKFTKANIGFIDDKVKNKNKIIVIFLIKFFIFTSLLPLHQDYIIILDSHL